MPRPKRSKVAPSAPTAVPFLQKEAAPRQPALMSGAAQNDKISRSKPSSEENADLYGVSDKENDLPERVPSSIPAETLTMTGVAPSKDMSIASGITMSKVRSTPQASTTHKGSQLSSALHRRGQATPRVGDSSMLSLGDFKRRSRQPSILGIGCADDTPSLSSLGGGENVALDYDDLNDFQPEDESTPLQARRIQPRHIANYHASSNDVRASRTAGRKRKITPPEVQVSASQEAQPESEDESTHTLADLDIPATSTGRDEQPDLPSPKRRAVTPPADGTMALPQSSPERSEADVAPIRELDSKRRTRRQPARGPKSRKPLSTAALQNLLPKRRAQPRKRNFDILSDEPIPSSSTLPSDQDEDDFGRRGGASKSKRSVPVTQQTKASKSTSKQEGRRGRSAKVLPTVTRTYGRRSRGEESDEMVNDSLVAAENEDEDDIERGRGVTVDRELPATAKRDIALAAAKFAEIDSWEMEFEDVSGEDFSSPTDAR